MPFQRTQTQSEELNRIQDRIAKAIADLEASPFVSGNAITQEIKAGSDNLIPHGLGRALRYWTVVRKNQNANVWEQATPQLRDQSVDNYYLNLWCSADCTITLWVS